MKKYEEPKMKLHELKTGRILVISRADTPNSASKQDVEDFDETVVSWN